MRADKQPMKSELMTRPEAARYLGISTQTLAIWLSTGRYELPVVKVGRLAKYRKADLDHFLRNRTMVKGQKPRLNAQANSPNTRDADKEAEWRGILSRWQQSKLNVRDFCKQSKIREQLFYSWRSKIRTRDSELGTIDAATTAAPQFADNPFMQLRIVDGHEAPAVQSEALEIYLTSGARIRVTNGTPMGLLARVLKMLESGC